MEISLGRIFRLGVALSQEKEVIAATFSHRFLKGGNRPCAPDEEGEDHGWKKNEISERERRKALRERGQILHASFFFLGGL